MFSSTVEVDRNPSCTFLHGLFGQNATASYLLIYCCAVGNAYSELLSLSFHQVRFLLLLIKHHHLAADFGLLVDFAGFFVCLFVVLIS